MKTFIQTIFSVFFIISFSWGQNQTYNTGTNTYQFNNTGTFQLTGIPDGTVVQIECYGAGGGGGGIWTANFASTSSGGGGGGGYAKLNYFTVSGGSLKVIVGKGGLKGTGSIPLEEAYDGQNGENSAVYFLPSSDTICKATGGAGSLHQSAANGSWFSPAKALGPAGIGGQGTIGDVLIDGDDGTTGTTPSFSSGQGGDGGNGAGPLGGNGGIYSASSPGANYGSPGAPYGGGGSGCADYEGGGGATYKIGGDGADGGVIITILDMNITTQPLPSNTFCAGDQITVDYTATGTFNTGNTFSLQLSDATGDFSTPIIIGSTNSTTSGSIIGTIPTSATGTGYRVRVVGNNPPVEGSDNGSDITIKATPTAPSSSTQDFCGMKTIADLSPNGANISWYSSSSSTTPLSGSQSLSTQNYYVTETVNGCESDKTTVQINIHSLPTIDAGTDQIVCDGDAVTLSGSGAGAGTYTWNHSVADGVAFTPAIGSITYTVTGTDENGCQNTDDVTVTVNSNPLFTLSSTDPTTCTGTDGAITLSGLSPNTTYDVSYAGNGPTSMTSNAAGDVVISGLSSGTYSGFTVATATTCSTTDNSSILLSAPSAPSISATGGTICAGENIVLSASGSPSGGTYSWDNGAGTNATATVSPGDTTTFTVTYTLNGCNASASTTVFVNPLPTIDAGTDQTVCDETPVTLSGSGAGSGATYTWSHSVTDGMPFKPTLGTTTFTVTATDENGCQNTDEVIVTVNPLPIVDAGSDASICPGDSVVIAANGAASYLWNNGLGSGNPQTVAPIEDSYYVVEGTNQYGCSNTDSVLVSIAPHPIAIAGDTLPSICKNETSIGMNGSISGSANNGYWTGGSGSWNNASDPLNASYNAGLNDSGWIQLQLIATGGNCPNDTAYNAIFIESCILSVKTEVQQQVKLYPNPAYNTINIEGENLASNYGYYNLTTMTGKIVKSGTIDSNHQVINVSNISNGLYLLQIKGKNHKIVKIEVQ